MSAQVRPGYKLTEVGVIPEDWHVSTVGKEFDIQLGKMLDSENNIGLLKPYLGNKSVQWGIIDITDLPRMAMSRSDLERYRLKFGDLLVCEGGSVGRAAIWDSKLDECYYQKALHRLRPINGFNTRLMLEMLRFWSDHDLLSNYVTKTSIAHLTREKFELVPMAIPLKSEQRAIAAALSDMDALISGLDQLIAKKRDIKQAAMQQLLTGKQRLPGFGGEWEVKRLESISVFITKGSTPTTYGFGWVTQGVLFLRSECVSASGLDLSQAMFISEAAHTTLRRSEIKAGDILMTITGNVGRTVFLDSRCDGANINQHIARIRISCENTDKCFVFHYLSRKEIRERLEKITTGQAYPQLSLKQVRELVVELPPLAEQTAIANALSEMAAELAALEARRDKALQLKQGMMQALLTGRIRLS